MPLDSQQTWNQDMVVSGREILQRLLRRFDLAPIPEQDRSETARGWTWPDGRGELGIIASVTEPFCRHCNRLRLTANGQLRACLFSHASHDLKELLRSGASEAGIRQFLLSAVWQKEERHQIGEPGFAPPELAMSCIGG